MYYTVDNQEKEVGALKQKNQIPQVYVIDYEFLKENKSREMYKAVICAFSPERAEMVLQKIVGAKRINHIQSIQHLSALHSIEKDCHSMFLPIDIEPDDYPKDSVRPSQVEETSESINLGTVPTKY